MIYTFSFLLLAMVALFLALPEDIQAYLILAFLTITILALITAAISVGGFARP